MRTKTKVAKSKGRLLWGNRLAIAEPTTEDGHVFKYYQVPYEGEVESVEKIERAIRKSAPITFFGAVYEPKVISVYPVDQVMVVRLKHSILED